MCSLNVLHSRFSWMSFETNVLVTICDMSLCIFGHCGQTKLIMYTHSNTKFPITLWYPCRAFFYGIMSCRVFLSSLDGIPYRTSFHSIKWLHCHKYCFRFWGLCGCTLCTLSLFLLIRYLISLNAGFWLWVLIQSFSNLAFWSTSYLTSQWPVYCMNTPLLRYYHV